MGVLQRIHNAVGEWINSEDDREPSGWLVNPDTTLASVLDYYGAMGGFESNVSRETSLQYPAVFRVIELTCAGVANLITNAKLSVVGPDGKRISNRRTDNAIEKIVWSPDGGHTDAWNFIEDCVADYCFAGNAFMKVDRDMQFNVLKLTRMDAHTADITSVGNGTVYRLDYLDGTGQVTISDRNVVHARYPHLRRNTRSDSKRHGLAPPPLRSIARAVKVGMQGDKYVLMRFEMGAKNKLHINFEKPDGSRYTKEAQQEIVDYINEYSRSGKPLVTFYGRSQRIEDVPEDKDGRQTREFQIVEATRIFGMPPPIMGVMVTEWGEGLESLARMWYRFGLFNHVMRFLRPMGLTLLKRGERFHFDETFAVRGDSESQLRLVQAIMGDRQRPPIGVTEEARNVVGLPDEIPDGTERIDTLNPNKGKEPDGKGPDPNGE